MEDCHYILYKEPAMVSYKSHIHILFMLKPRHAHCRTFRMEEQQQQHTHTSLFHHRGFTTRGFTIGGSPQRGSTRGGAPQGFTMRGGGGAGVMSVSVSQVLSHAYIWTKRYQWTGTGGGLDRFPQKCAHCFVPVITFPPFLLYK